MTTLLSILGFLALLGPLVIVHEFGHYFFAKLFNVRADIFSIGFGPVLFSKQIGETNWRVSAIPLGGFVKLFGEEPDQELPPEEKKRALNHQEPWKRFFIFFGGPLFNFLFAILVFMAILAIGEPKMANVAGRIVEGSNAEKAGFRTGDKILTINGKEIRNFEDYVFGIAEYPGTQVEVKVLRALTGSEEVLTVTPTARAGYSMYGESKPIGEIDGLLPVARGVIAGISNPTSTAAKAGFKTGDELTKFNGKEVKSWEDVEKAYQDATAGANLDIEFKRGSENQKIALTKKNGSALNPALDWGLYSAELFVENTLPKSPAQNVGIQKGDRITKVGTKTIYSFDSLKDEIQDAAHKSIRTDDAKKEVSPEQHAQAQVSISWERNGQNMVTTLNPIVSYEKDPSLNKVTNFTIGIAPFATFAEPETVLTQIWNPVVLLYAGTERMLLFVWRNIVSLYKIFVGDVSVKTLGGPILIAKIAGTSIERGLISFLSTMAILSVGLGILNILPVPVLDGGHILLLGIEAVRRRPLTLRQVEIFQQVGLVMIMALLFTVFVNDISRIIPVK